MAAAMHWMLLMAALVCNTAASPAEYYTYDGRGNNLIHDDWGSVGQRFLRKQVPAATGYGPTGDMSFAFDKSAREISLGLTLPPYRSRQRNAQHKTDMLTYIGQFFNHDIDLREEGVDAVGNRMDVQIDHCDLRFNKPKCTDVNAAAKSFSMVRSNGEVAEGTWQQINTITAYLDGSVVYGSDAQTADKLRSRYKGKMLTFNGELPKNTMEVTMANPAGNEPDAELRAAGDVRANVNPILLAIQSLFLREHNRLAEEIYREHPTWNDEQIFQKARKWNVAFMQSICYYEYIPLLGIQLPVYTGYKSTVNPGIDNFFATVSYRYGHSEVNDVIARVNDMGENIDDDSITLMEAYFFPSYSLSAGIEPLLRGASFTQQAEVSPHFASSLQNYLFGVPAFGGVDLFAINLQRGRDHGMPSYNEARSALGLVRAQDFSDITSDVYLQKQLEDVYVSIDNVEPYAGGCAEDGYREANFGELFYTSLADQYTRIRDGDRFYFENEENGLFTSEEINNIRTTGLRDIILRNTDIQMLPQNIYVSNPQQPWPLLRQSSPFSEQASTESTPMTTVAMSTAGETLRSGIYEMEWESETMNGDAYLKFKLMCQTDGWIGIGIAEDDSSAMVNADIIIARFSGGAAVVDDYWAQSFSQPTLDTALGGSNDVELISGSQVGGQTTVEFRRKVVTGDTFDREISRTGTTPIIYAWHSTSHDLEYHTALRRGKASIDFYAPFRSLPSTAPTLTPTSTSVPTTSSSSPSTIGGSVIIDESRNLRFTWKTEIISGIEWLDAKMTMKISGPAWMGVVIEGPIGGFNKADFIKVTANSLGACSVRDYWAETVSEILLDSSLGGSDDTISSFCYVSGGYLDFEFKRRIQTGDNFDRPFLKNAYTDILFAYDDSTMMIDPATMQEERLRLDVFSSSWTQPRAISATPADTAVETTTVSGTGATDVTTTPVEGSAATAEPSPVETPAAAVSTSGEITLDDGTSFVLGYELFKEDIAFTISFTGLGFAAIGIPGDSLNMVDADVFAVVTDGSGGCSVGDYWSTSFVAPVEDTANGGSNDLSDVQCSVEGDTMTATFKRKLTTGDASDRDIVPSSIPLIYAFSTTAGGLQYHGPTGRGSAEVQPDVSVFEESSAETATTDASPSQTTVSGGGSAAARAADIGAIISKRETFLAHTWFSGLGFGLFAVVGVLIERVGRGWGSWKRAHFVTQMLSTLFVFTAQLIALARAEGEVEFAHCVLTYVLFMAMPPQALLSFYTYRRDRWVPAWKKLNRIVDYFVLSIGFFQFWMSLRLLDADVKAFQLFYTYAFSVLVVLLFVPRSSDRTKQLPLTTGEEKKDTKQAEAAIAKSFTDKIAAKSGTSASPSFTQRSAPYESRRSSLMKATSRKSETKIPAFSPASTSKPASSSVNGLFQITPEEFQEKVSNGKNWTVINDKIYEMEKFQNTHPGGSENIEDIIGKDGTELYMEAHENSDSAHKTLAKYLIGTLDLNAQ